jgi:hypothetical protein
MQSTQVLQVCSKCNSEDLTASINSYDRDIKIQNCKRCIVNTKAKSIFTNSKYTTFNPILKKLTEIIVNVYFGDIFTFCGTVGIPYDRVIGWFENNKEPTLVSIRKMEYNLGVRFPIEYNKRSYR